MDNPYKDRKRQKGMDSPKSDILKEVEKVGKQNKALLRENKDILEQLEKVKLGSEPKDGETKSQLEQFAANFLERNEKIAQENKELLEDNCRILKLLEDSDKKCKRLETEKHVCQREKDLIASKLGHTQNEVESLKKKVHATLVERHEALKEIEEEKEKILDEFDKLKIGTYNLQDEYTATKKKLQTENVHLQVQLDAWQQTQSKITEGMKDLENKHRDKLEKITTESDKKLMDLERRKNGLEDEIVSLKKEREMLEKSLDYTCSEKEKNEMMFERSKKKLEDEIKSFKKERQILEKSLDGACNENEKLIMDKNELENKCGSLELKCKTLKNDIDSLEKKCNEVKEQTSISNSQQSFDREEMRNLENMYGQQQVERDKFKMRAIILEGDIEELKEENMRLEEEMAALREKALSSKSSYTALKNLIKEKEEIIERVTKETVELKKRNSNVIQDLKKLRVEKRKIENEDLKTEEFNNGYKKLLTENKKLKTQLAHKTIEGTASMSDKSEMSSDLTMTKDELTVAKGRIKRLEGWMDEIFKTKDIDPLASPTSVVSLPDIKENNKTPRDLTNIKIGNLDWKFRGQYSRQYKQQ